MRGAIKFAIPMLLAVVWAPGFAHAQATPTPGPPTSYAAYPSPQQEPGPSSGSPASAIAFITFDPYLTQAQVTFYLSGLDASEIAAFHLHCGLPGQLGPLVVNFNIFGAFTETFKNGVFSVTITDADVSEANWPPNPQLAPPPACLANAVGPAPANTIAGIESLARTGQLYFNLHTGSGVQRTFVYGLIRGQVYAIQQPIIPGFETVQ